eukprot:3940695-Rhodomonas_salina.1
MRALRTPPSRAFARARRTTLAPRSLDNLRRKLHAGMRKRGRGKPERSGHVSSRAQHRRVAGI